MNRLALVVLSFAIILLLAAAPVPKVVPPAQPLYFPTQIGAKWVYDGGSYPIQEVTAVEQKEKEQVWVVSVTTLDNEGKKGPLMAWEVSAQGLFLIQDRGKKNESKQCYLRLPHKAGEKWQLVPEFESNCVSLKSQRTKVPAGEFETVGVEMYLGKSVLATRWYAPGVGLVSIGDEKMTTVALKSFTLGKD